MKSKLARTIAADTISIRRRLLIWLLLPLLFLWLISAIIAYHLAIKFSNIAYDRSLADNTRDISKQMAVSSGQLRLDLPRPAVEMLLSDEYDKIYFKVSDAAGRLIAGEPDLPMPDGPVTYGPPVMRDSTMHGHRLRIAARYFSIEGQTVLVQMAETLNKRAILQREIVTVMVLPQLVLILTATIIVWLGVRTGLRPLHLMRDEIAARSHRDLTPIEESHTPQEMLPVTQAVNDLLKRLDEAMQMQRRFISDAAHQLRTPLAGLKAQLDVALQQAGPENMRHALQHISTSVNSTARLVKQMLVLAQVEYRSTELPELKPLDLNETAREITAEWVTHALKKDIDLGYEGPEKPALVSGDALRIKMLLDNLLDNAILYSPRGSCVTTRVEVHDKVILTVEDNGPGIPREEREMVFRRFYRVMNNAVNDVDGSGLGLAIVQDIVDVHGAQIVLEDPADQKGTMVKISFSPSPATDQGQE